MSKEIYYERVTAIKLTQENDDGDLESRFFPQVERTEVDTWTDEVDSTWMLIPWEPKYYLTEKQAIERAIEYRDRDGKRYL